MIYKEIYNKNLNIKLYFFCIKRKEKRGKIINIIPIGPFKKYEVVRPTNDNSKIIRSFSKNK